MVRRQLDTPGIHEPVNRRLFDWSDLPSASRNGRMHAWPIPTARDVTDFIHALKMRRPGRQCFMLGDPRSEAVGQTSDDEGLACEGSAPQLPLEAVGGRQVGDDKGEDGHGRSVLGHQPCRAPCAAVHNDQAGLQSTSMLFVGVARYQGHGYFRM